MTKRVSILFSGETHNTADSPVKEDQEVMKRQLARLQYQNDLLKKELQQLKQSPISTASFPDNEPAAAELFPPFARNPPQTLDVEPKKSVVQPRRQLM